MPCSSRLPLDYALKDILTGEKALGGDPGWCMEHEEKDGKGCYRVYADPDIAGFEPSEVLYSVEKVKEAAKETLLALAESFPERAAEAYEVIERYHLSEGRSPSPNDDSKNDSKN